VASLDDTPASGDMRELLNDIAGTSRLLSVTETRGGPYRTPSFSINPLANRHASALPGCRSGTSSASLVLSTAAGGRRGAQDHAGAGRAHPRAAARPALRNLYRLSCHNCPDVVQALNVLSLLNPGIRSTAVDGALFQDEVQRREVMAVPAVFANGESFVNGRIDLDGLLERIEARFAGDAAAERAARQAAELSQRAAYDMLIVGAGPAGAAAAVYAARKGLRVGVLAERFGGQTLDTLGIENFISVAHTEGPQFARALENHVREHANVEVITGQRARQLEAGALHRVQLDSGAELKARSLILATGARWRELGVPGEAEYRNKGVAYCPHCDGPLFKGQRVAVVGGGNSGVEAAIDLAGIVREVTLLEFAPQLKADEVLVRKLESLPNVRVLKNVQTQEVTGSAGKVDGLRYLDRASGESHQLPLEGVFVQIGLVPNTDWLKGTLSLSRYGEIEVDAKGATSQAGVFAAGDCTTVPFKQIIIAAGDGAKAALGAFDALMRQEAAIPATAKAAAEPAAEAVA
jgi:alkyl hydroperoxide reductase subunit F